MRFGLGGSWGLGSALAGVLVAAACGGTVAGDRDGTGGASTGGAGTGGTGGVGGTGGTGGFGGTPSGGTGGLTGGTGGFGGSGGTYVDPGCPDAAPPPPIKECDLFGANTCPPGESCYPFVQYPSKKCEQEVFGSVCAPTGKGTQGDPCGPEYCAGGHVCVVTGQGTECVKVCDLFGAAKCPPGLFCVPIDVEGVGGCY